MPGGPHGFSQSTAGPPRGSCPTSDSAKYVAPEFVPLLPEHGQVLGQEDLPGEPLGPHQPERRVIGPGQAEPIQDGASRQQRRSREVVERERHDRLRAVNGGPARARRTRRSLDAAGTRVRTCSRFISGLLESRPPGRRRRRHLPRRQRRRAPCGAGVRAAFPVPGLAPRPARRWISAAAPWSPA